MTWLLIIVLAGATFLAAAFALKLPRAGWALFGAALMLGLAGYALQASPNLAGAPKSAAADASGAGAAMVEERRALFDTSLLPSRFVVTADGFSRRGQYAEAAQFLRGALDDNPQDTEAWLALGNALVEHADGQLTPAAMYAYRQAELSDPAHPGAGYFLGVGLLRSGRPGDARQLWQEIVANAPEAAPWKPLMEQRLARLDDMLSRMGGVDPANPVGMPR
ncbi:MAG: tetratricopeptide repeat protein [Alteripontixanthobacter sp.]